MKTIEELEEIFISEHNKADPAYGDVKAGLRAVITAYLESVEGVPSLEKCGNSYDSSRMEVLQTPGSFPFKGHKEGVEDIRNLFLPVIAKLEQSIAKEKELAASAQAQCAKNADAWDADKQELIGLKAKLEAVSKLPERWRLIQTGNGFHSVFQECSESLEKALASKLDSVTEMVLTEGLADNGDETPQHHQPPAGLVLHNPDNLSPEQVGLDNRLLCTLEVDGRFSGGKCGGQYFHKGFAQWFSTNDARRQETTYRVPLSTPWPEATKAEEKPVPVTFEQDGHIWTRHKSGDPCPVDGYAKVEILQRDGHASKGAALEFDWSPRKHPQNDIIAYRIADPAPAAPTESAEQRLATAEQRIKELEAESAKLELRVKELEAENDGLFEEIKKACVSSQAFEREAKRWQFQHPEVQALKSRISILTPRPISQKPIKEDGWVIVWRADGRCHTASWNAPGFDDDIPRENRYIAWLPSKLCPDLLPKVETAEEREEREFNEWYQSDHWAARVARNCTDTALVRSAWKANHSTGKEGK